MRRVRIIEGTLKGLKPAPKGRRVEVYDAIVPDFGIRSTDNGAHSFIFYAPRLNGEPRKRWTIGRVGEISLAEARSGGGAQG
jgi:hypothetical protein